MAASAAKLANLFANRARLREKVFGQIELLKKCVASTETAPVDAVNDLLAELLKAKAVFSSEHNSTTDLLDPEESQTADLHKDADDVEQAVMAAFQVGSEWVAAHTGAPQPLAGEVGMNDDQSNDQVFDEQSKPSDAESSTPNKSGTKPTDADRAKRDSRGRSDSSRATQKSLEEIKAMLTSRAEEFDRLEMDCSHKEAQLDFLQQQRKKERDSFLDQINDMEREIRRLKTKPTLIESTPSSSARGKSVSWPKDDISTVSHSEPDRERARAAGARLKSVCHNVQSNNVNVTNVGVENTGLVHNDSLSHDQSSLSLDSGGGSGVSGVRGVVTDGVYSRRQAGVASAARTHDVSTLSGFAAHNQEIMQSLLEESRGLHSAQLDLQQIPKAKLKVFTGDPLDYWLFLKTFDDLVDSSAIRDCKKLNTLLSHCSESVQKLLHGCLLVTSTEGYHKARAILRARFGNPFLISQAWKSKLASYPRVSTPELLENYGDDLLCCFNTLNEMGHISELENSDTLSSISSRLDNGLRAKWRKVHRAALKRNESGKFKELVDLIVTASDETNDPVFNNSRLDKLLDGFSIAPLKHTGGKSDPKSKPESRHPRESSFYIDNRSPSLTEDDVLELQIEMMAAEVSKKRCQCCDQAHFTSACPDFQKLEPRERLSVVRRKRLCLLCLNPGHFIDACQQKWKCQAPGCVFKHHNLLHGCFPARPGFDKQQVSTAQDGEVPSAKDVPAERSVSLNSLQIDVFKTVTVKHAVLPIAPMIVSSDSGSELIYGLLDPGSTATICTKRLVNKLKLHSKGSAAISINTMTGKSDATGNIHDFTVKGASMTEEWPAFDVVSLDELPISCDHILAAGSLQEHSHLSHLDIPTVEVKHIDLLIGQDNAHLLRPKATVDGRKLRDPFAVRTPLGWTIYGIRQGTESGQKKEISLNAAQISNTELTPSLEELVARSWELDKVPTADSLSAVNRAVVNRWEAELKIVDGYITLPIPLKSQSPCFPDNRSAVLARLTGLGKRLKKNPELHTQYREAMATNFKKGYAEVCTEPPPPGLSWNLTQLPVTHKRKPGVVRPVWNGGFIFKGVSLNQEVHQGPDLTNRIPTVMTNFRLFRVAMMGDVKQMYNQVRVPADQKNLMRFLYWEDGDPDKPVIDCCLTYHMFGGGWSPSICAFALQKIVELQELDPESELALTILKAFYVDDCLKSVVDTETGITLFTNVISTLGSYRFDFTKIVSNMKEVMDAFPEEKKASKSVDLDFDGGRVCVLHSLGQRWLPDDDVFIFVACFVEDPDTRRELLSTLSSLYDPLGLCTPFLIPAKRLLQELSKRGLSWDDKLPADVREQWKKWVKDAAEISQLRIPRWVGLTTKDQKFLLLHFCDASEIAYGSVCYLGALDEQGEIISTALLTSKCKLAPLKTQSIPRLELCAAVLAAELDSAIRTYIEVAPLNSLFWSDSTLVLRYLNSEPSNFKTFISNRVSVIQQHTSAEQWMHVPTDLNPADILSRGSSAAELASSSMWLKGPDFLVLSRAQWPTQPDFLEADLPEEEVKKIRPIYTAEVTTSVSNANHTAPTELIEECWSRVSCWLSLVSRVAWWVRLLRRWRDRALRATDQGELRLEVSDRETAIKIIIKAAQSVFLTTKERTSKTFQRLFPRLRDGMLCIGGRLERASFPTEFKHPYVMPANNTPAHLFIMHCHNLVFHAGVERTLMEVRKTTWILTGKKGVSTVLKSCFVCRKYKSKPMTQLMADLPPYRLMQGERPFSYVGLDYLGPLETKAGRSTNKRYICVIVCSVSRAIHLEVAIDLSTSAFLNAFNRFIARRGKPKRVLSDNGTNFVGAKNELSRESIFWNKEHTEDYYRDQGISWSFNPPAASHFGGMWERHNRTIRSLMLCAAEGRTLTDDGLSTLMCMIEQSLNSRPLTRLSDDPADLSPLTPNHILLGDKVDSVKGVYFKSDVLRRTWKQAQFLTDCFWKRWSQQYLAELQRRTRWLDQQDNLKEGALILLVEDNFPRFTWPLGLVVKVHAGSDGLVRAADVKTSSGVYTRPIAKLVLLEADLHVG